MLRGKPSPPAPLPQGEGKNTNTAFLPSLPLPVGEGWGEGSTNQQKARARILRQQSTDAENLLWSKLRNRQLGAKFRRQHPIGYYFADFACLEAGLVIELDGSQHADNIAMEYDEIRRQVMESAGFQTLRFKNTEVLCHTSLVLERIMAALTEGVPSPPAPLPQREGSNTDSDATSLPSRPLPVGEGWGEGLHPSR